MNTKYLIFFLLSLIISPQVFTQEKDSETPEWKAFFDGHEAIGTLLVVDNRRLCQKVSVYDGERTGKHYSPASTFKLPHTLFVLDSGLVKDEFQILPWDGVKRGYEPHNQDQNLRSAMRNSAIWVYESFAKEIGEKKQGPT